MRKSACNLAANHLNRGWSGNTAPVIHSQSKQVLSQVAKSKGRNDASLSRYFITSAACFFIQNKTTLKQRRTKKQKKIGKKKDKVSLLHNNGW